MAYWPIYIPWWPIKRPVSSQQEDVSIPLLSWQEVSLLKGLLGNVFLLPIFPFSLPWQTVINWSLIWLPFCQTEPPLSTPCPMWARDLPGNVIPHVPSVWNSPHLTAQRCNPAQQEHVSHMSLSFLSLIFLSAVCSALWALGIIRIYLAVLKSSMLLKRWKKSMFLCHQHGQSGQRLGRLFWNIKDGQVPSRSRLKICSFNFLFPFYIGCFLYVWRDLCGLDGSVISAWNKKH